MPVFMSPGNVAFSVFGFDIYFYGILMGISIVTGLYVANRTIRYLYGYDNVIFDIAPLVLLGGVLGARLYYCILNHGYYFNHLPEIFDIRGGGLSIHGGMLGGAIALWHMSKKSDIRFSKLCDGFALGFPIAQAIARWGNFFNSEAFGRPTDLAWGVFIPIQNRPNEYIDCSYFHPTFLYESILDLFIFIIMLCVLRRHKLNCGCYAALYLILYSITRILVESLRIDSLVYIKGIPFPIIVSVCIILFAGIYLFKRRV